MIKNSLMKSVLDADFCRCQANPQARGPLLTYEIHRTVRLKAPLLVEAYNEVGGSERRCQGFGSLVTPQV